MRVILLLDNNDGTETNLEILVEAGINLMKSD